MFTSTKDHLRWPDPLELGATDLGTLSFQDEDEDVVQAHFQSFDGDDWVDAGRFDPGVKDMPAGSLPFELSCPDETGILSFRVQLEDEDGNMSG